MKKSQAKYPILQNILNFMFLEKTKGKLVLLKYKKYQNILKIKSNSLVLFPFYNKKGQLLQYINFI